LCGADVLASDRPLVPHDVKAGESPLLFTAVLHSDSLHWPGLNAYPTDGGFDCGPAWFALDHAVPALLAPADLLVVLMRTLTSQNKLGVLAFGCLYAAANVVIFFVVLAQVRFTLPERFSDV
jgi:hypothetical protein